MTQHHWKDVRNLDEREDDIAGTGGEKARKLGHLTYVKGKPVEGLCYCGLSKAHDANQQEDTPEAGLPLTAGLLQ